MKVINNTAYRFYNELIQNYSKDNIAKGIDDSSNNKLVHAAIMLAGADAANPFEPNTPAYDHYFSMMRHHGLWRLRGADMRVSRRRFLDEAVKQAALQVENPFDFEIEPAIEDIGLNLSIEALKEVEYAYTEQEDIETGTYVPVQEPAEVVQPYPYVIMLDVEETDNDPETTIVVPDPDVLNGMIDVLKETKRESFFKKILRKIKSWFVKEGDG